MESFDDLVAVVARLRAPDGCPWDRAQDPSSMRPYLVEEAYEVVEAIERDDPRELREELGDLLFQVVLLAQMASESGWFDMADVAGDIRDKMVRRHPHVFDPEHDEEDAGTVAAWEARKARERRATGRSMLDGLPSALPALIRAHRIGEKVAKVGFDWPDQQSVRAKVDEELGELDEALEAGDHDAVAAEYGDVLLAAANLGRFLGLGPEEALRESSARFERRFRHVERLADERDVLLHELDAEALDGLGRLAKAQATG